MTVTSRVSLQYIK